METQDNGFLLVIDGVRKEKERLTAAKLFFLSFNPMVLSRLPALVSIVCIFHLEIPTLKRKCLTAWEPSFGKLNL